MANKLSAADQKKLQEVEDRRFRSDKDRQARLLSYSLLHEYEPMVCEVLNRSLEKDRLANAYLFTGGASALKQHTAILLAQTILMGKTQLIDESSLSDTESDEARLIGDGAHPDEMILVGDTAHSISLDNVMEVTRLFSQTAKGESGRKVYIIQNAEYMTIGAMNGLLKFLEEPTEGVYAILTTDNSERILPTVLSRCVTIPFHPLEPAVYEEIALAEGCDPEDAYLLSFALTQTEGYIDYAAKASYQTAKSLFKQWLSIDRDRRLLFTDYEFAKAPRSTNKDFSKEERLEMLYCFFSMALQYEKDAILKSMRGPSWYINAVLNDTDSDNAKVEKMKIALEQRDKVNRNNDLSLVMAQAVYRWEEVKQ